MKSVMLLVVFGLVAINTVYGLKCYTCDGCSELKDVESKECTKDTLIPELPTSTTTKSTTTESTTVSTTTEETEVEDPEKGENPGGDEGKIGNDVINRKLLSKFLRDGEKDGFKCFTQTLKYGDKDIVRRGCTKLECKTVGELKCESCDTDGCNFGITIKSWALSSLVLIAIVKMYF